jgi:predicted ArsR family transcriptional regulator
MTLRKRSTTSTGRPKRDREISDPRVLRALAHPLRWSLIDLLALEGTATATRCAEVLGESQATCSFHLRQLAKYGVVQQAPSASKRERPWKLKLVDQRWSSLQPDEATSLAAAELSQVVAEREMARLLAWVRTRHLYPESWQRASAVSATLVWLTDHELQELTRHLVELTTEVGNRFADRASDQAARPAQARPVRLLAAGYPLPGPEPAQAPQPDSG